MWLGAHHPQRVRQMIIIDAGKEATHEDVLPKIKPSLDRLGKPVPSWDVYIGAIKKSAYYADGTWNDDLEAYYRADVEDLPDGQIRSRVKPEAIEEAVTKIIAEDWEAILRKTQPPAILIHAPAPFGPPDAPPVLTEPGARVTVELLGDCQYVQVPGHHITMLFGDNAPHVVQAIREFVNT